MSVFRKGRVSIIPVDGDDEQGVDGDIERHGLDVTHDDAHGLAERPGLVQVVVEVKRRHHHGDHEVGQGEVGDQEVGDSAHSFEAVDGAAEQPVARAADDNHESEA